MPNDVSMETPLDRLPEELRIAQEAIETDEVQEMVRRLAKYNLGVYMPHLHETGEGFYPLPSEMIAVEENMITRFISRKEAANDPHRLPVAWRWIDDEAKVSVAAKCLWYNCY